MKARVDPTSCSGYGACTDTCPSVFQLDEFGYSQVTPDGGEVPADQEQAVRAAVAGCPENAISAED